MSVDRWEKIEGRYKLVGETIRAIEFLEDKILELKVEEESSGSISRRIVRKE